MRFLSVFAITLLIIKFSYSQNLQVFNPAQQPPQVIGTDQDAFIYLGYKDGFMHLVWDHHTVYTVEEYIVEKSLDGVNFTPIGDLKPANLFDIHTNTIPSNFDFNNQVLYSTETGFGRFIYNDVLSRSDINHPKLFYRIKMKLDDGSIVFTRIVSESANKKNFKTIDDRQNSNIDYSGLPAQFQSNEEVEPTENFGTNERRAGCPPVQTPPAGYMPTANSRVVDGDCCYYIEQEHILQNITNPCGGQQAWCCSVDCSPLAYDPCCVHTCSEYNRCSCPPWICCNISTAQTIWVVISSTDYTMNASVDSIHDVSCNGLKDGAVSIATTGGIPNFNYSWNNGTITGDKLTDLDGGNYDLTVTDQKGCTETLNFTIHEPTPIITSVAATNIECFGDNDATVNLSVSGGVPPYTYSWNGGMYLTEDLANVSGGPYTVTITDATECTVVDNGFVNEPANFSGTISTVDIECFGWSTGTAVLNVTGGLAPVTYQWMPGGYTNPNVSNLTAGTYMVTATDANGCTFTESAVVDQLPRLTGTFASTTTSCGDCTGTATITVSGGSGFYSYQWNFSAGGVTTATANNLCAGLHTVEVSDVNTPGCSRTFSITIGNSTAENLSIASTDVSCFGECDGSATVTLINGCSSPPCIIEWFEAEFGAPLGQTAATATGLCAGDYSARITNADGCQSFANVTITEPTEMAGSITINNATCNTACIGSLSVNVFGGVKPYTYQWNLNGGNLGINTADFTEACAGNYSVVVTDANGCTAVFNTVLPAYNVTATYAASTILCNSDCDATIVMTPSGGQAPYTYNWLNTSGDTIPGESNASLFNLCAGEYTSIVTDVNGCYFISPIINITEPDPIAGIITKKDIVCASDCNGSANVFVLGGTLPYNYQWFDKFNVAIGGATTDSLTNVCSGTYTVEITDANGCKRRLTTTINQTVSISLALTKNDVTCNGDANGSVDLTVTGGDAPFTYSWNNGDYNTEDLSGLSGDTYTVLVTDNNGCTATGQINVNEPQLMTINTVPNTYGNGNHLSCNGANDGSATAFVSGGSIPYSYQWDDPANQQVPIPSGLALGTYHVTVVDVNGCSVTDTVTLDLEPDPMTATFVPITYGGGYNVSCHGASDGFIDLTIVGGTPPLITVWDTGSSFAQDLANATAGMHTVNIVDTVNSCIIRDTIILTGPPALDLVFNPSVYADGFNISMNDGTDGSIDLEVSGGVPPYTYLWNTGDITQDIQNLDEGVYTCEVTDANGCVAINSIFLQEPPVEVISDTSICEGDSILLLGEYRTESGAFIDSFIANDGDDSLIVINLTVLPVFSTFVEVTICEGESYFAGGADQTVAGTYVDVFMASTGCDSTVTTDLSVAPDYAVTNQVFICFGESYFAGGADQSTSGTYIDILSTVEGCDSVVTTELEVGTEISLSFDVSVVDCGDTVNCNGTLNVNTTGGTPPYTYNWSNGANIADLDSLCAGTYFVTVTDADGCTAEGEGTILDAPNFNINISQTDIGCNCNNLISSHSICVIDFAGLPHGTQLGEQYAADGIHIYGMAYGGLIGQLIVFNSNVTGSPDPDLEVGDGNFAIFPENLTDLDGDALVDEPNDHYGGGKQIYEFDEERTVISFKFVDLENKTVTATAYDSAGNVIKTVIAQPQGNGSLQTVMVNATGVRKFVIDYFYDSGGVGEIVLGCDYECCDGTATVNVTGGVPPYSYQWSNGELTATADSLCAGTYSVTISDVNGCSDSATTVISGWDPLVLSTSQTDATQNCFDPESPSCLLNFNGLPHGTILNEQYAAYGIHILGIAYGDLISELIVFNSGVTGSHDPDLEVGIGNLAIFPEDITDADGDGLVDDPNDHFAGGKQIYEFDDDRSIISLMFVDKEDKVATATAYDVNGDIVATASIFPLGDGSVQTVNLNAAGVRKLVIDYFYDSGGVTGILFDCAEECCDGSASVAATGGTPPYTYQWSNGGTTADADSLCAGDYEIMVTDAAGCEETAIVTIDSPAQGQKIKDFSFGMEGPMFGVFAYPVPFRESFVVDIFSETDEEGKLRVFNILGQEMINMDIVLERGTNKFTINSKEWLSNGMYLLDLRIENKSESIKLYKVR